MPVFFVWPLVRFSENEMSIDEKREKQIEVLAVDALCVHAWSAYFLSLCVVRAALERLILGF